MNRLKSILRSVTGVGRSDEQKVQKEREAEAIEVEESETETFNDALTDEDKISSSESESENVNLVPELAHCAEPEEADGMNCSQTKEAQAETQENNAEGKENLPKGNRGQDHTIVGVKRKAQEVDGNKRKKVHPLLKTNPETTPEIEIVEVQEETVSAKNEEEMDTSEQNEGQDSSPNCSQDVDEDLIKKKALRRDLKLWMKKYENMNQDTLRSAMNELADLRSRHRDNEDWEKEAISLRDVQERMEWAAKCMKNMADAKQKWQVAAALRHVLTAPEKIREPFPCLIEIYECLQQVENSSRCPSFKLARVEQVPGYLKTCLNQMEMTDFNLEQLQGGLESTMKGWFKPKSHCYEYQTVVGVLHLFGFDLTDFSFRSPLTKEDFIALNEMTEIHLANLRNTSQKQACLLNLALCSVEKTYVAVVYMIKHMPKGMCKELKEAVKIAIGDNNTVDTEKLRTEIQNLLPEAVLKDNLTAFAQAFKYQLKCANRQASAQADTNANKSGQLDASVAQLLKVINMTKYYPQKLTYEDVIKLGTDVYDDVNKKPTSLPELPWYFMKHIIGLDSNTRENCHVARGQDEDSSDSDDSDDDMDEEIHSVHPLDLVYAIFLCADDFLRQELMDKMLRCQYSVPFILPSPKKESSTSSLLHWSMQSATRSFYENGRILNKALVDVEAPLVTCSSIGEEPSWKSRLLNKMLSPQQETFWHQGLKGGHCKQKISQGMVEVAWYLPGGRGGDTFFRPVAFANVREKSVDFEEVNDILCKSSSVSCIFTEDVSQDVLLMLENTDAMDKIILLVLHRKGEDKRLKKECKQLQEKFKLEKHQIIRKSSEDVNFNTAFEQLKRSIDNILTSTTQKISISRLTTQVENNPSIEVDDWHCYHGEMAANTILKDIDEYNRKKAGSAKAELLPSQSDLESRREMAHLDKEICRQRKLGENTTVQNYAFDLIEKKWQLQLKQLQKPVPETFKYFLQCLIHMSKVDRKYFLQCLKLGLNQRSVELLQPLYEEYEKCRLEDESEERDERLKSIDEKLTYGSLGIEHFFRELAVLYDNIATLKEKDKTDGLNDLLDSLAKVMAEVLMDGTAIEVMDGDSINVPVAWLSAVLNRIEDSSRSTLLKVAVIGAQSCGKSTLLNTTFGLNFPVSSGRCTRGAYMQLVKVDGPLKETLKCDYVAVIDSEGLMSRSKVDSSDYDNELSTFVIGLSDLTLVIIKGEGNEMQDVLPLAIHVFLRMNILGEHQACHFVHQNMGAVDVMTKVATEIDAFVRDLNAKTLTAAKDVDQSDKYKRFTDVLKYDATKDNTYVPGLWDGALPMGKTNADYSKTMQRLKMDILKNVTDMQTKNQKRLYTFCDVAKRLDDLWNAIKYENFVLSFRNVLAVEAHKKLTKIFKEEQWAIKRELREMIQQEECIIENEIKGHMRKTLRQLVENSNRKMAEFIQSKTAAVEKKIMHYFRCAGCNECSAEVTNRHLLANNEKEFEDEIKSLGRTLTKEVNSAMDSLETKMQTDTSIHRLSQEMDDTLRTKVQEVIRTRKSDGLRKEDIEEMFDVLWTEATGDILRTMKFHVDKDVNIEATVQMVLRELFGPEAHMYMQQHAVRSPRNRKNRRPSQKGFSIEPARHMEKKRHWNFFNDLNKQDIYRLKAESDKIIQETRKYYDPKMSQSAPFNQKEVEMLFKDVLTRIDAITDERFKVKDEYRVELVAHIECLAIAGFTEMHQNYCKMNSPETLLGKKRKSYRDLFLTQMSQGDTIAKFCETVLKDMILKNIKEQLSCTELLHDLRVHCGDMFRDIKSVQASIMVDLYREKQFARYISYITDYEGYVRHKLKMESIRYFHKENRLKALGKLKLEQLLSKVCDAVDKTVQTKSANDRLIKVLLSNIESLKVSHNEAAAYLELSVPDKKQFREIVRQQLKNAVKVDIIRVIKSWDVGKNLEDKGLAGFLFVELVGCSAKCPFCYVPCDAHSGGKTQGNHSAILHRPQGLSGFSYKNSKNLVTSVCSADVASQGRFRSHRTNFQWQLYRDYYKFYPNWTIHGEADPCVEKYWKWVLANFNTDIAGHFSQNPGIIPEQWRNYSIENIKQDIEDNYHVQVDISELAP